MGVTREGVTGVVGSFCTKPRHHLIAEWQMWGARLLLLPIPFVPTSCSTVSLPRPQAPPWTESGGRILPSPVASPRPSRHGRRTVAVHCVRSAPFASPRPSRHRRRTEKLRTCPRRRCSSPWPSTASRRLLSAPRALDTMDGAPRKLHLPSNHGPTPCRAPAQAPRPRRPHRPPASP
ncbi:hypothetical protein BRADI_4g22172v3 [Brachypodium distachyon]|uniref:Uncharacterized protein n=1 Tax=Brachypodium distachyon TaxID=15368 RepID=A0A0Q3EN47_BRADI|nr:hypothetical protein BRADI_4g22172v3 [Brachypodium distachyon]